MQLTTTSIFPLLNKSLKPAPRPGITSASARAFHGRNHFKLRALLQIVEQVWALGI